MSQVTLTSYYGKSFVNLSERKSDSSTAWLVKKLYEYSVKHPEVINELAPADVFDNYLKTPFLYGALAKEFRVIGIKDIQLIFNYLNVSEVTEIPVETIDKIYAEQKQYICGINKKGQILAMDDIGNISASVNKTLTIWAPLGSIHDYAEIEEQNSPIDFSVLKVFNKPVAVGVVLSYYMGLNGLLVLLENKYGLKYRVVDGARTRINLAPNEYTIKFGDKVLVADRNSRVATFILSGFNDYDKKIRTYPMDEFNKPDVYLNLLKYKNLSVIYLREMTNLRDMFIDPITKSILEELNEPTTFEGLLLRSTELLMSCDYPDSQDTDFQRIRGYERFAGTIYKELSMAVRAYRNKNMTGRGRVDMPPYQVWQSIMKDSANKLVEDTNPIQNLKENEIVTFVGTGGREKDSLNKKSREYHANDIGVISEATVDSGDTGINTYTSANPQLMSARGILKKEKDLNATSLLSTSVMCAVGAMHDVGPRVMFISVQQSHTVAAIGYHQPIVRTGYEYVVGHRTSDLFCATAKQDGVVKSIGIKGVVIENKDGTQTGVATGRQYGKAEGSVYPYNILVHPFIKEGKAIKKGQVIAYNDGFFEQDMLDPSTVVMKSSMNVKVALVETGDTHEDSCAISKKIGQMFAAKTTHIKSITLNFDQEVSNVVKIGQLVNPNDPILIIQDEITSGSKFDSASIDTLKRMSSQAPKSKYKGVIDRIEVFYNGDKEDMSESIRALADRSDKELLGACKATNSTMYTGEVNEDYRVAGVPLAMDRAEIRIYITTENTAGVGDKGIFCNQMKGTIGRVLTGSITTERGEVVDATFSYKSVNKRVVISPIIIGTSSTLLKAVGKNASEMRA